MKDFISLGSAPSFESCCQVGRPNYDKYGRLEAKEYKRMLESYIKAQDSLQFKVTRNPHDFGYYYDVILEFDCEDEETINLACSIEDSTPTNWLEGFGPGFGYLTWNSEVHADEYLACSLI